MLECGLYRPAPPLLFSNLFGIGQTLWKIRNNENAGVTITGLFLQADTKLSILKFPARMVTHQYGLLIDGAGFDSADIFFITKRFPWILFMFSDNKKGASNAILQVNSMVQKLRSETQTSAVSMVDNTTFNKERSWAWPSSQEENI